MVFPYPAYYPNQREIIDFISSNAVLERNPVFESPTGSGKTIAVLSALIPHAKKKGKKILYLCRTHEQMDRVIEELRKISEQMSIKGISLRSRREMCLNDFIVEKTLTAGEERLACSILKKEGKCSHYRALSKDLPELNGPITALEILSLCRVKGMCPYEYSRILLSDCEVIACSYLYVFEPGIRAAFLKAIKLTLNDFIMVLDEAHNLPRLGVSLASQRLTEFAVSRALKEAEEYGVFDTGLLERLQRFMVLYESDEKRLDRDVLISYLEDSLKTLVELEALGEEILKKRLTDKKRPVSFIYSSCSFVKHLLECDKMEFAFFISKTPKGMPFLEILSLEPKTITMPPLEEAYLSVHMSGTLTPIEPYCEVIGLKDYMFKSFPSPFPKENIAAFVDTTVSTLGSMRSKEMYKRIGERIKHFISQIPGNVLVFFPSYVVLDAVINEGMILKKESFFERSDMSSAENNEMIKRFKRSKNAVLFGVQQGRNSEGQDFPGEQANAVLIVGIPYSIRGPKVAAQIEYYKGKYKGWWGRYPLGEYYAYFLPAYRSLNQAAGRAHRNLTDRAAIIFLERRVAFDRKVLANISPWIKENMRIKGDIEKEVEGFYKQKS